jgi:four helix bundle protein
MLSSEKVGARPLFYIMELAFSERIKNNPVLNKSFDFSIAVIAYCRRLYDSREFILSNQLLRSATSIGANIFEAQDAESQADFIHKMKIASKEAKETEYWLWLCRQSERYPHPAGLLASVHELNLMLGKIISTSKRRQNRS